MNNLVLLTIVEGIVHLESGSRVKKTFLLTLSYVVLTKMWRFLKKGNSQGYLHYEDAFQNTFLIFEMQSDVTNERRIPAPWPG